jgi:hypothetical protein
MLFSFSALSLLEDADADISDTLPLSSSPTMKLVTHSAATAFPDSGALPRGGFFSSCGCRSVSACTKGTETVSLRSLQIAGRNLRDSSTCMTS